MVALQVEATNATTTAFTLPGSGGAADADMTAVFYGHTDLWLEVSTDNSQWTEAPGTSAPWYVQGFAIYIARGMYLRVRNNNAGTTRTAVLVYRYLSEVV